MVLELDLRNSTNGKIMDLNWAGGVGNLTAGDLSKLPNPQPLFPHAYK